MNSRLRISRVQYHEIDKGRQIAEKVQSHCECMSKNLKIISEHDFFRDRTIIVRYRVQKQFIFSSARKIILEILRR